MHLTIKTKTKFIVKFCKETKTTLKTEIGPTVHELRDLRKSNNCKSDFSF